MTDCGVGRLCCAVLLQPRSSHCHLPSLPLPFPYYSPTLIVVGHTTSSILSHFLPYTITPSHHGEGQTCSYESQCCHVRPTAVVLIAGASGSADCGQLFQQVCFDRVLFFERQSKSFDSSIAPRIQRNALVTTEGTPADKTLTPNKTTIPVMRCPTW